MKATVLFTLLNQLVTVVSPHLVDILRDMAREFENHAKKTSNQWDDVLAGLLNMLIGSK